MTDKELRQQLASQLSKYFGNMDKVRVFARECKSVGFDISDVENIKRISEMPEEFTTLINYSQLGLLPKLGRSLDKLHGMKK